MKNIFGGYLSGLFVRLYGQETSGLSIPGYTSLNLYHLVESGGDSRRIRQVVVGVKIAIVVDDPRLKVRVVHVGAAERTRPEIRAVP